VNQVLKTLRTRIREQVTYLTDAYIVPSLKPPGLPLELIPPAAALKDGTITRQVTALQGGLSEELIVQGAVFVEGFNPRGEAGVIVGDEARDIKGTAQIINDLTAVFDGDVTSLDNATDCQVTRSGPSRMIVFGPGEASFWQTCPFTVRIKRRTCTQI
jgi:hypothetical protein